MLNDEPVNGAPTRRDTIKYGGAVVGGGLLAGCTSDAPAGTPTDTGAGTETDTVTPTENPSRTVTMSPVGDVTFEEPPERAVAFDDTWLDHLVALGQAEKLVGFARPDSPYLGFYDQLPEVSVDTSDLTAIYGDDAIDKEALYELDPGVLHIDPVQATRGGSLDEADVTELRENLAPFFANRFSLYNSFEGPPTTSSTPSGSCRPSSRPPTASRTVPVR
jgi:ABC-type Fe3+-hydroxamate transport system substrate-binding protein